MANFEIISKAINTARCNIEKIIKVGTTSIDIDLINDYVETDPGTLHEKRLLSRMNKCEVNLTEAMLSIRQLILAANRLGITFVFSTESAQITIQKIRISIANWAIRKHGDKVINIAEDALYLLLKWIKVLNGYRTYLYGTNEAIYIKSMGDFKFDSLVKISCKKGVGL